MIVLGLGMAISVAPLTTTVMGAVDPAASGAASGINNAVAELAGMLAIALFGALAVGIFASALDARLTEIGVAPELRRALDAETARLAAATVPPDVAGEARQALAAVLDQSFLAAFRAVMIAAAGLAAGSACCAAVTIAPKPRAPSMSRAPDHAG